MTATTSARLQIFSLDEIRDTLGLTSHDSEVDWSFNFFPCDIRIFEVVANATFHHASPRQGQELDTTQQKHLLQRYQTHWTKNTARYHLEEAYRLAAIIYINELFNLCYGSQETSDLVAGIVHHAEAIPHDTVWFQLLAWPMYQAGVESRWDRQVQNKVLQFYGSIERLTGCRHGRNAAAVLEAAWATPKRHPRTTLPSHVLEGQLVLV